MNDARSREENAVLQLWAKHFRPRRRRMPPEIKAVADKARKRTYYLKNAEAVKAKSAAWRRANPDKVAELIRQAKARRTSDSRRGERTKRVLKAGGIQLHARCNAHVHAYRAHLKAQHIVAMRSLHDAHVRVMRKSKKQSYRLRYATDPDFALSERMRRQQRKKLHIDPHLAEIIRVAMKADRRSNRVETMLGYTIADLRAHLTARFLPGMTWDAFGRSGWHVDHILPRKCFAVGTLDGIRAYWALTNLQPLWAADNLRKGARVDTQVIKDLSGP